MVYLLAGSESPLRMSAISSPVTSVVHSKSSSLRRRRKPARHAGERQSSTEKHNGEVSTSASGKTLTAVCALNVSMIQSVSNGFTNIYSSFVRWRRSVSSRWCGTGVLSMWRRPQLACPCHAGPSRVSANVLRSQRKLHGSTSGPCDKLMMKLV